MWMGLVCGAAACMPLRGGGPVPGPGAISGPSTDAPDGMTRASLVDDAEQAVMVAAAVMVNAPDPDRDEGGPGWRQPGDDVVVVLFSSALDPAGVDAGDFLLIGADERRWWPSQVSMSPNNEPDELQMVTLSGAFGDVPLTSVEVVGRLYDARGRTLFGASVSIDGEAAAPRVAAWRPVEPAPGRCGAYAGAVRLWWTHPVRPREGAAPASLAAIASEGGGALEVVDRDDDDLDHVVDLCLDADAAVSGVSVDASRFEVTRRDGAGGADRAGDRRGQARAGARGRPGTG